MPRIEANGVSLRYEDAGPKDAEPVLLISGVGTQLTRWSGPFVDKLVARGWRVVRLDDRDIGVSQWFDAAGAPNLRSVMAAKAEGRTPHVPCTLDDMAADAAGLLDALGIGQAHLVGASMGGMTAQLVAMNHPEKALSLTSIMSNSGNPALPRATPEAQAVLTAPRIDPAKDREGHLAQSVKGQQAIGSPGWPEDEATLRARAEADLGRAYHPAGFARQYAAILAAPDRREKLRGLSLPTVVIHGERDPLVRVEGGRDTAEAVPGAELVVIPGMGHNIPDALADRIIQGIERAARR